MITNILGGLFLIGGAYMTWRGNIFWAIIIYSMANVCWLINATIADDLFGFICILIGSIFGILTLFKMHHGIFFKQIG